MYGYLQLDRLHPVKYYEHSIHPTTAKENLFISLFGLIRLWGKRSTGTHNFQKKEEIQQKVPYEVLMHLSLFSPRGGAVGYPWGLDNF